MAITAAESESAPLVLVLARFPPERTLVEPTVIIEDAPAIIVVGIDAVGKKLGSGQQLRAVFRAVRGDLLTVR